MKIVLIRDPQEKVLDRRVSPFQKSVGIVSLEKIEDGTEFTVRILGVDHIRYHYDPKTQKFELDFLSYEEAIPIAHQALKIAEEKYGPEHPSCAV